MKWNLIGYGLVVASCTFAAGCMVASGGADKAALYALWPMAVVSGMMIGEGIGLVRWGRRSEA